MKITWMSVIGLNRPEHTPCCRLHIHMLCPENKKEEHNIELHIEDAVKELLKQQ